MKLSLLILLSAPLGLYAQTHPTWKNVDQPGFRMSYPGEWTFDESGQMGTKLIVFAPLESSGDVFKENVNLIVQDLTGYNLDLEQYAKLSLEQVKTMITNSSLLEHTRVAGKVPHYKTVYTGDQGIYKLKFEQYYFVVGNTAHVLTFTSEQKSYDKFKAEGERILDSFELK